VDVDNIRCEYVRLVFGKTLKNVFTDIAEIISGRFALIMEAARTSETLVNFYQTTRRYNPEDSHLRTRRENLIS
jgi:hypothetical protein